jgi:hypothetical protein
VCGKTEKVPHRWEGDRCARCGAVKSPAAKVLDGVNRRFPFLHLESEKNQAFFWGMSVFAGILVLCLGMIALGALGSNKDSQSQADGVTVAQESQMPDAAAERAMATAAAITAAPAEAETPMTAAAAAPAEIPMATTAASAGAKAPMTAAAAAPATTAAAAAVEIPMATTAAPAGTETPRATTAAAAAEIPMATTAAAPVEIPMATTAAPAGTEAPRATTAALAAPATTEVPRATNAPATTAAPKTTAPKTTAAPNTQAAKAVMPVISGSKVSSLLTFLSLLGLPAQRTDLGDGWIQYTPEGNSIGRLSDGTFRYEINTNAKGEISWAEFYVDGTKNDEGILGTLATISYDGSSTDDAKKWVTDHMTTKKEVSKKIATAEFVMLPSTNGGVILYIRVVGLEESAWMLGE